MSSDKNRDILGMAINTYLNNKRKDTILVHSDKAESQPYSVPYFLREVDDFPAIEKLALQQCKGRILDAGAGAGIHSKWLLENGYDVLPIDTSSGCVKYMHSIGISQAQEINYFNLEDETFDTILMLMNGFGIMGTVDSLPSFFDYTKKLLKPGGQIIFDSSDLIYLYQEDDGSIFLDINDSYYGEMEFTMEFDRVKGDPFKWLFIDPDLLEQKAEENGFKLEVLYKGENFDYLGRLTLNSH